MRCGNVHPAALVLVTWAVPSLAEAKKAQAPVAVQIAGAEDDSLADSEFKGFFADCEQKVEVVAGNHYKVFDCGGLRAQYYDSPSLMSTDDVVEPLGADARTRGYFVDTRVVQLDVAGTPIGVAYVDYRTPPAGTGPIKSTLAVVTRTMVDGKTRVYQCKMPGVAGDAATATANETWCTSALTEMWGFTKKTDAELAAEKAAAAEAAQPSRPPEIVPISPAGTPAPAVTTPPPSGAVAATPTAVTLAGQTPTAPPPADLPPEDEDPAAKKSPPPPAGYEGLDE